MATIINLEKVYKCTQNYIASISMYVVELLTNINVL